MKNAGYPVCYDQTNNYLNYKIIMASISEPINNYKDVFVKCFHVTCQNFLKAEAG